MNDNMIDASKLDGIQRIGYIKGFLDKLADAKGREKCTYIALIDEFLDSIRDEILIKDEQIKDLTGKEKSDEENIQNGGEN